MDSLMKDKGFWSGSHVSSSWNSMDHSKMMRVEVWLDVLLMMLPFWVSILAGLLVGWSWRPRWVSLLVMALRSRPRLAWSFPPGFGARRLWLAATAATVAPVLRDIWTQVLQWVKSWIDNYGRLHPAERLSLKMPAMEHLLQLVGAAVFQEDMGMPGCKKENGLASEQVGCRKEKNAVHERGVEEASLNRSCVEASDGLSLCKIEGHVKAKGERERGDALLGWFDRMDEEETSADMESSRESNVELLVTEDDLRDLYRHLEEYEEGSRATALGSPSPPWEVIMEKTAPCMKYTAWRRDPKSGPTEYRSRTELEKCTAQEMRDFFWDDDFRPHWDDLLISSSILSECPTTGFQIIRWVRKFPFFCKDREYIIGRRIWSDGDTFYCITKGVEHRSVPRKSKPRRVDVFNSSWRIRPLEGGSCEVLLFHVEDMGIQKDIAKMGIRQGMWPAVKKMEPGMRKYQRQRSSGKPLSRSASFAGIHTPISLPSSSSSSSLASSSPKSLLKMPAGTSLPNLLSEDMSMEIVKEVVEDEGNDEQMWQWSEGGNGGASGGRNRVAESWEGACDEGTSSEENRESGGVGGEGREVQESKGGKRTHVAYVVAGSMVAVLCGVDKALMAKIVLAQLAQQLVARLARRRCS